MTTKEILIAARARIEKPENWFQGQPPSNTSKLCTQLAISRLVDVPVLAIVDALIALRVAAGIERPESIVSWNDAPERTHADVLAAYDKAIAAAT